MIGILGRRFGDRAMSRVYRQCVLDLREVRRDHHIAGDGHCTTRFITNGAVHMVELPAFSKHWRQGHHIP